MTILVTVEESNLPRDRNTICERGITFIEELWFYDLWRTNECRSVGNDKEGGDSVC